MKMFTQLATVAEAAKSRNLDAFQLPEHLTLWLIDTSGKRRAYPCMPAGPPQGKTVTLVAQVLPAALKSIIRYEVTDADRNVIAWCSLDEVQHFAAGEQPACMFDV
jgi:hypothetical protein